MQRLLMSADWDADAVRDDVRDYVVEHLVRWLAPRPVCWSSMRPGF